MNETSAPPEPARPLRAALPADHPQRLALHNEAHARPSGELVAPLRLSYLALLADRDLRERQWRQVCTLCERFDVPPPPADANHFSADFGAFRLTWERHTEFARYKVIVPGAEPHPFAAPAIEALPADWLGELAGEVMVAAHVTLCHADAALPDDEGKCTEYFECNPLVGASVSAGAGTAWTDFRFHADGFSRWLVQDRGMTPRQAGRTVQRLLEIDTYRMLAMLALPVANALTPEFNAFDEELARITRALSESGETEERALLERLTQLQVKIENRATESAFRFGAARAYYALVQRRVHELREQRRAGLQTFQDFVERRLAPAMHTCASVAERQSSVLERVSRTTDLLSTRVDIIREEQTQALLESMNRRAKLQLRLQQTVEGLSIAAITYYIVGLVGYAAKGLEVAGVPLDPDLAMAISIPLVVGGVAYGVHGIRKAVSRTLG